MDADLNIVRYIRRDASYHSSIPQITGLSRFYQSCHDANTPNSDDKAGTMIQLYCLPAYHNCKCIQYICIYIYIWLIYLYDLSIYFNCIIQSKRNHILVPNLVAFIPQNEKNVWFFDYHFLTCSVRKMVLICLMQNIDMCLSYKSHQIARLVSHLINPFSKRMLIV